MILFEYSQNRDNNFKLIAFIASISVLFSHSWPLSLGLGHKQPIAAHLHMTSGTIAVDLFFIISGFFITRSLVNRQSIFKFFRSRLLRIYPGMIVSTLVCVFALGVAFTSLEPTAYLTSPETWKFIKRNTLLFNDVVHFLPGVFADNIHSPAVVGAVWTLPYQVRAYVYVTLLVVLFEMLLGGIQGRVPRLLFIGVLGILIVFNILNRAYGFSDDPSIRLFAMFAMGSVLFPINGVRFEWH